MIKMPPSYGSREYWEQRFTAESEPFEWLEAPHVLDSFFLEALKGNDNPSPKVLHIGCGTSRLSYHLRTIVQDPSQIHNIDYSQIAIKLGREREQELYGDHSITAGSNRKSMMQWDAVDLLDHASVLSACEPRDYSIIVDKSTSDSIACSDDVHVKLPYMVNTIPDSPINPEFREPPDPIHPLHIMAIHLALVTKPGTRWISLSYSDDRFPFVDGLYSSRPHLPGFPDTGTLWKLLDKREIENLEEKSKDNHDSTTHRPKIFNWVYILERTEVPLYVRGAQL